MHFQIFVPATTSPKALEAVGLSGIAAGAMHAEIACGPGGLGGMLFSWDDRIEFRPELTRWIESAARPGLARGAYHVGIWLDSPPCAADLQRGHVFDGCGVKLGDGGTWIVPAAGRLPRRFRLRPEDGRHEFQVRDEFAKFWRESAEWYRLFMESAERGGITLDEDAWRYAYDALSLNYRLTPEVDDELRLFDTSAIIDALRATIDGISIRDMEATLAASLKKKESPVVNAG